jgi:hypothetical protein
MQQSKSELGLNQRIQGKYEVDFDWFSAGARASGASAGK